MPPSWLGLHLGCNWLVLTLSIPALPCPTSVSDGRAGASAAAMAASEGEWRQAGGWEPQLGSGRLSCPEQYA